MGGATNENIALYPPDYYDKVYKLCYHLNSPGLDRLSKARYLKELEALLKMRMKTIKTDRLRKNGNA